MNIDMLRERIPEYARDLKLNLSSVLKTEGAPGLDPQQIAGVALASAIAARHRPLIEAVEKAAGTQASDETLRAARAAAAIMGMNNVYYRFLHLVGDSEYATLPARLRMNVIGQPGVDKVDFELFSLAVSAVNGCGMCIESHEKALRKHGVGREAVQSAVRIAAVVNGVATVLDYEQVHTEVAEAA